MKQQKKQGGITLFYSYAHADETLRDQLETHLSQLRREGMIAEWHDRKILPGRAWADEIDTHLETASIILLLVSPHFLASDYCYEIEMKRALERHRTGVAHVVPIIVRPCDWQSSPFARLQCLPHDGKAVTTWENYDEAFLTIAQGLRRVIERQQIPARPSLEVERQHRTRLIQRVRMTWIKELLDNSLYQRSQLELHLQERPDILINPWSFQVQDLNHPPQPLPPGTSIVQVYDESEGAIL